MKKLLLYTLLMSASIHGMNADLKIVSFDYAKHSQATLNLFNTLIADPFGINDYPQKRIIKVLVSTSGPTEAQCETVLGAIAYRTVDNGQEAFTRIIALAIDKQHERKKLGALLMQHVENSMQPNKNHHIQLFALEDSTPFYEKLGYSDQLFYMEKVINRLG